MISVAISWLRLEPVGQRTSYPAHRFLREQMVSRGQGLRHLSDSGTGIDAQDLPLIFERFFRGKNADGVTGTGLGLSIAFWVANQHGGDIEAESMPGRGSRFSLVLPLA